MSDSTRAVAIFCGSGGAKLFPDKKNLQRVEVDTPYGKPSEHITVFKIHGLTVYILNRHGVGHTIPPHRINYRANIWAVAELGCDTVVAVATVGGIRNDLKPGNLLLPDQIIDYTSGRESSFFDGESNGGTGHLECANPYCTELHAVIMRAAVQTQIELLTGGTYAATQGPRLETAAEINRIEKDGGDVVGMTGMPETVLAAEKKMCYASINLVVNAAAGRGVDVSMDDIRRSWETGFGDLRCLLKETIRQLSELKRYPLRLNSQILQM